VGLSAAALWTMREGLNRCIRRADKMIRYSATGVRSMSVNTSIVLEEFFSGFVEAFIAREREAASPP
jgi:hypothetical protein